MQYSRLFPLFRVCRRGDVAVVQTQYTVIVLTLRFRGNRERDEWL